MLSYTNELIEGIFQETESKATKHWSSFPSWLQTFWDRDPDAGLPRCDFVN